MHESDKASWLDIQMLEVKNMKNEFRLRLNFLSLVSIAALIGFCAGVISIPLIIIQNMGNSTDIGLFGPFIVIFASPIFGAINGAFLGLLGYPLYFWITKKISFKYKGEIYASEEKNF